MANIKISALPAFTEASGLDKVPVVDVSSGDTKAYTIEQLLSGNYTIPGLKTYTGSASWDNVDFIKLPNGTTAERPAVPLNGMIRYNTDLSTYEFYNNGNWGAVGSEINTIADNTSNAVRYPLFSSVAVGADSPRTDSGFTYNPSTGILSTTAVYNTGTSATKVPVGTTAQRPTGADGLIRYNTTLVRYEGYINGTWNTIGGGATGGGTDSVFHENGNTVTTDYTITTGKNAVSAGPITIADGATVTIPDGSNWVIV